MNQIHPYTAINHITDNVPEVLVAILDRSVNSRSYEVGIQEYKSLRRVCQRWCDAVQETNFHRNYRLDQRLGCPHVRVFLRDLFALRRFEVDHMRDYINEIIYSPVGKDVESVLNLENNAEELIVTERQLLGLALYVGSYDLFSNFNLPKSAYALEMGFQGFLMILKQTSSYTADALLGVGPISTEEVNIADEPEWVQRISQEIREYKRQAVIPACLMQSIIFAMRDIASQDSGNLDLITRFIPIFREALENYLRRYPSLITYLHSRSLVRDGVLMNAAYPERVERLSMRIKLLVAALKAGQLSAIIKTYIGDLKHWAGKNFLGIVGVFLLSLLGYVAFEPAQGIWMALMVVCASLMFLAL